MADKNDVDHDHHHLEISDLTLAETTSCTTCTDYTNTPLCIDSARQSDEKSDTKSIKANPPATVALDLNNVSSITIPHSFVKKTFHKPNYCHHCTEFLWGFISQGFICLECNFVCHERCKSAITSPCSQNRQTRLKISSIPHFWGDKQYCKKKFCNFCRKRVDLNGYCCVICGYTVHNNCRKNTISNCRYSNNFFWNNKENFENVFINNFDGHHWIEGNSGLYSKCIVCRKNIFTNDCLNGYNCSQCDVSVHYNCLCNMDITIDNVCEYGEFKNIILPPKAVYFSFEGRKSFSEIYRIRQVNTDGSLFIDISSSVGLDVRDYNTTEFEGKLGRCKETKEVVVVIYDGHVSAIQGINHCIKLSSNSYTVGQIFVKILDFYKIDESVARDYFLTEVNVNNFEYMGTVLIESEPLGRQITVFEESKRCYIYLRHIPQNYATITVRILRHDFSYLENKQIETQQMSLDCNTRKQDIISTFLSTAGLDHENVHDYNLFLIIHGLASHNAIYVNEENLLNLYNQVFNESVNLALNCYFLVKLDSEDMVISKGLDLSQIFVCVGNLTTGLAEKEYFEIIKDQLILPYKSDTPFEIKAIYHEFGTVVLAFWNNNDACMAIKRLETVPLNDRVLQVNYLPIIDEKCLNKDSCPLLVLVNVKSGGRQGKELMKFFKRTLNPHQVFDLMNGGPLPGFYAFRNIPKYRILICGGDGSLGWTLRCLDNIGQDAACSSPSIAILPLGTGNDMARVMKWGSGYTESDNVYAILKNVDEAKEVVLDRWTVIFQPDVKLGTFESNNSEDNMIAVMNNYCGIGIDADVSLSFHNAREQNPSRFNSRLRNKGAYFMIGLQKLLNRKPSREFCKNVKLQVDGKNVVIPYVEGILILNITSWASGANAWGKNQEEHFDEPTYSDHLLEIVGFYGVVHMAQIKSGLRSGVRIAQGGNIKITIKREMSVQVDGEPWKISAGDLLINKSALTARMLVRSRSKLKHSESTTNAD